MSDLMPIAAGLGLLALIVVAGFGRTCRVCGRAISRRASVFYNGPRCRSCGGDL